MCDAFWEQRYGPIDKNKPILGANYTRQKHCVERVKGLTFSWALVHLLGKPHSPPLQPHCLAPAIHTYFFYNLVFLFFAFVLLLPLVINIYIYFKATFEFLFFEAEYTRASPSSVYFQLIPAAGCAVHPSRPSHFFCVVIVFHFAAQLYLRCLTVCLLLSAK